jgi:hypothetical protein
MPEKSKLILGHNSFFGINHADYEKGKNTSEQFINNYKKIIEIIDFAKMKGLNNFMISTLDESKYLIDELEKSNLLKEMNFYILLPYINKYVRKSNEIGLIGIIKEQLTKASLKENLKHSLNLSTYFLDFDYKKILTSLVEIELQTFEKVNKKIVILHDALTDILLSLKRVDIFEYFIELIENKYKCKAGFATKNFVDLDNLFRKLGTNTTILTHANQIGFNMNPGKSQVENSFKTTSNKIILMSVLASGYLKPEIAIKYVKNLGLSDFELVIGSSRKEHIAEIISLSS